MSCLRARFSFLTEICSFWLILHWCILRMYAMGKGSGKTFTTLRYSFDLLLVTNQKVYKALFKLMSGVFSFIPFWCLCQKSSLFLFNKFSFFTTNLEWFLFSAQIFLAQWGNSSPHKSHELRYSLQAPPSMGLSRKEYWCGLPLPSKKPTHLWTLYLWQRRQEYTMEKRQSL